MSYRPAKRRRIASSKRRRRKSTRRTKKVPLPPFDLALLRRQFATFFLVVTPSRKSRSRYDRTDPRVIDSNASVPRRVPLEGACADWWNSGDPFRTIPESDPLAPKIAIILKNLIATHEFQESCQRPSEPSFVYLLVGNLLYSYKADQLTALYRRFCPHAASEASASSLRVDAIRERLSKLFKHGWREAEEKHVVVEDEINAFTLFYEICGFSVPHEILHEILSFIPPGRQLLFRVGMVSKDFYRLVLSSWKGVVKIDRDTVQSRSIPRPVLTGCRIVNANVYEMPTKELKMFCRTLGESCGKLQQLVVKIRSCTKRLKQAVDRTFRVLPAELGKHPLLHLQKIIFGLRDHWDLDCCRIYERFAKFRISSFAPNVQNVHFPWELSWCEGLLQLRSLSINCLCFSNSVDPFWKSPKAQKLFSRLRSFKLDLHQAGTFQLGQVGSIVVAGQLATSVEVFSVTCISNQLWKRLEVPLSQNERLRKLRVSLYSSISRQQVPKSTNFSLPAIRSQNLQELKLKLFVRHQEPQRFLRQLKSINLEPLRFLQLLIVGEADNDEMREFYLRAVSLVKTVKIQCLATFEYFGRRIIWKIHTWSKMAGSFIENYLAHDIIRERLRVLVLMAFMSRLHGKSDAEALALLEGHFGKPGVESLNHWRKTKRNFQSFKSKMWGAGGLLGGIGKNVCLVWRVDG